MQVNVSEMLLWIRTDLDIDVVVINRLCFLFILATTQVKLKFGLNFLMTFILLNDGFVISFNFTTLRVQHAILNKFLVDLSDLLVEISGALIEVFIVCECLQIIVVVLRKIITCTQINIVTVAIFVFILSFTVHRLRGQTGTQFSFCALLLTLLLE